jgi:adenylyltransferase/sulfurtransferase
MYLAAAGVGRIGVVDFDVVDYSNLQRQIIHGTPDVGRSKLASAKDRLEAINPHIEVLTYETALSSENAFDLFADYDVILDGTDNFPTRYLTNDACVLLGKPNAYGSIFRFEGQASVFATKDGPCYRCLYPEPPPPGLVPSCAEGGVLGVLPGVIGVIQATEVIKTICRLGDSLAGRLLIIDGLGTRFQTFRVSRDADCPMCSTREIRELVDYEAFCGGASGEVGIAVLSPADVAPRLSQATQVIDVREPWEWEICRLPGAQLVPLAELEYHIGTLDPQRETIVYCHRGVRSVDAAHRLQAAGFTRVAHLAGGIDRWSVEMDASVARY